jgi:hypothetical protein
MMFMPFDWITALEAGKKTSPAKAKAARRNGQAGGRPASRTLAERLLNRKLSEDEHEQIKKLWRSNQLLLAREGHALLNHFGGEEWGDPLDIMDSNQWRRKSRRMPKEVKYLVAKFRLAVRYSLKPTAPPKNYVVVTVPRSEGYERNWERQHPDIPCPPLRQRRSLLRLPDFKYLDSMFARHPETTAKEVMAVGGSQYTRPIAEALVKYLRYKHAKKP